MKERISQPLEGVGAGLFWISAGLTLLAQTAPFYWVGEALSDLRWHLGLAALIPAIPAAVLLPRRRLTFVAMIALGFYNLLPGMRVFVPPPDADFVVGTPLSVVNVRWGQASTDALVDFANQQSADVFVVSGLNETGRNELAEHLVDWPYVHAWPPVMADSEGAPLVLTEPSTMLFSRISIDDFSAQGFGYGACLLEGNLDVGDLPVTFRVASFPAPGPGHIAGARTALMNELGARPWVERGLFVCDLSSSDSSNSFGDLMDTTRYQDARRGFGRVPTIPTPFVCGLRMPGQYVLFGDEIAVSEHSARPLVAGERELVTLRADDETDTFWPVLTHMRVRGISNSAPAESSVAALDAPAPR